MGEILASFIQSHLASIGDVSVVSLVQLAQLLPCEPTHRATTGAGTLGAIAPAAWVTFWLLGGRG